MNDIKNLENKITVMEERLFYLSSKHYPILQLEMKIDELNRQNRFEELGNYVSTLYLHKKQLKDDEKEKREIQTKLSDFNTQLLNMYRAYFASQ